MLHGLALAKAVGAAVTILTVTESWSAFELAGEARRGVLNPVEALEQAAVDAARRSLDAGMRLAQERGVAVEPLHVADSRPAEGIVHVVTEKGCDLIVMASHWRRGLDRLLLGSQATEVLTHSRIPVLIRALVARGLRRGIADPGRFAGAASNRNDRSPVPARVDSLPPPP